jgi:hypothetical protein
VSREVEWRKPAGRRGKPAVTKKVDVMPAPIPTVPTAKGQAPTTVARGPVPVDLRDLLPPLDPTARAAIVEALADIVLAELDDGNTDPDPKE